VILVASHVHAVSGIAFEDALWNIPAALAYQLDFIFWQDHRGAVFRRDARADILKELS
jgi:hypothetical protein